MANQPKVTTLARVLAELRIVVQFLGALFVKTATVPRSPSWVLTSLAEWLDELVNQASTAPADGAFVWLQKSATSIGFVAQYLRQRAASMPIDLKNTRFGQLPGSETYPGMFAGIRQLDEFSTWVKSVAAKAEQEAAATGGVLSPGQVLESCFWIVDGAWKECGQPAGGDGSEHAYLEPARNVLRASMAEIGEQIGPPLGGGSGDGTGDNPWSMPEF